MSNIICKFHLGLRSDYLGALTYFGGGFRQTVFNQDKNTLNKKCQHPQNTLIISWTIFAQSSLT